MRRDSQKLVQFSVLAMLGLLPAVCGCSPKPPVRSDPEPKASLGQAAIVDAAVRSEAA